MLDLRGRSVLVGQGCSTLGPRAKCSLWSYGICPTEILMGCKIWQWGSSGSTVGSGTGQHPVHLHQAMLLPVPPTPHIWIRAELLPVTPCILIGSTSTCLPTHPDQVTSTPPFLPAASGLELGCSPTLAYPDWSCFSPLQPPWASGLMPGPSLPPPPPQMDQGQAAHLALC